MFALLLLACTRATPPEPPPQAERGPYGEWADESGLHIPRAALAHLVAADPIPFEPMAPGFRLHRDDTGLLGAMGLLRDDVLMVDDQEAALDSWFTADTVQVPILRGQVSELVALTVEGPPVPPPVRKMTTMGEPGTPLPSLDLTAPVPRGWLAHHAGSTATPLRVHGEPAGYRLEGPFFTAAGLSEVNAIDGNLLHSDEALYDALDSWFSAEQSALATSGGPVTLRFAGPPTSPPGAWTPELVLSLGERQARAGVVVESDRVLAPRSAVADVLYAIDLALVREPLPEGVSAGRLLNAELATLLGLTPDTVVLKADDTPLASEADMLAVRRRLLAEDVVALQLVDRALRVEIAGPPLTPPEGWPRSGPFRPQPAVRGIERGDPVVAERLAVRSLLGKPRKFAESRSDRVLVGIHPLFDALDLPSVAQVHALDGEPVAGQAAMQDWLDALCSVSEASIETERAGGGTVVTTVVLTGAAVPCR